MTCIIKRILQFQSSVVFGPVSILDAEGKDMTETNMYSWSSDGVCWTSWVNYKTYLRIAKNIESDFYLRILISSSIGKVVINGMETKCYSICLYNSNPFLEDFCSTNLFNPYMGLDCALQLQQQLSDSVVCMLGIPIYYFRVLPQQDTADYTFKEYVMHNVESVKQMKMMIEDGAMPSSKPQFSDLDFDWETDWNAELSKTAFATAFGDTAFPKQRDFIYVPMQNRMWEVNSAYDEKNEGLMWHSTTWKLGLIKWNEKTNVEQGNFDELIDNLVINKYENVFAELEENEQQRTTATTQIERPLYTANNLDNVFIQDAVRKQMSKSSIEILQKQYNNKSQIIAKNIYRFLDDTATITYQKGYCGEEGTLSFIVDISDCKTIDYKPIIRFGNIEILTNCDTIKFGNSVADLHKKDTSGNECTSYLVICKWSRKSFVQEVKAYPYTTPSNIPLYKLKPEMNSFDFTAQETNGVSEYSNDNMANTPQEVIVTGWPLKMTNIKLFNKYLSEEQEVKESTKYTTTSKICVINDLARPLDTGNGYSTK